MNVATASTTAPDGTVVTARDRSNHFGAKAPFTITKAVNASRSVASDGVRGRELRSASSSPWARPVTWTYLVTNTGDAPIDLTSVTDDGGVAGSIAFLPGLGEHDRSVRPLQRRRRERQLPARSGRDVALPRDRASRRPGQYTNTATANGVALIGALQIPLTPVTDVANLYGTPPEPKIHVVKR